MKKLFMKMPEVVQTALIFLLVFGCLSAVCAVSVKAEVENGEFVQDQEKEEEQKNTEFLEKVREIEEKIMKEEGEGGETAVVLMSESPTIADILGMDGAVYLEWLESHENDTYYLTTPYKPFDWRSPNGDISFNGEPGMNCTGFVWHALMYPTRLCNGNTGLIPGISGWVTFYRTYDIQRQYFQTREDMLASGYLEKGDIIWMFDGTEDVLSDYHHIAIYWGDGHSDVCWHSIDGASDGNELAYDGNIISRIAAKCASPYYLVLKTGGIERPKTGRLTLKKSSENPEITDANSCYSLEGAEYTVYQDQECVTKAGVLRTDVNGNSNVLELEEGEYWIKETRAPEGYLINATSSVPEKITIAAEQLLTYQSADIPQRGCIRLQKQDAESGMNKAQGGASLAGAVYEVYNSCESLVQILITDVNGEACTKELPLGSYTVKERSPSPGYLLNREVMEVELKPENDTEALCYSTVISLEQVIRGDLELTKIGGGDTEHVRLEGVPFRIISKTTGEEHVIVTDRNGYASTEASWNPHTQNTNRGKTAEDGVWFGTDGVNDQTGALPYDTYIIEEIECESNQGYQLIEPFEVVIEREGRTIDLDTLTDIKRVPVRIGTTALVRESGTKEMDAEGEITILDTVTYEHLQVGKEYVIKGILMEKESEEALLFHQKEVTAEKKFCPSTSTGTVVMEFGLDASELGGRTIVVFETLFYENTELAVHANLEDEEQTIRIQENPEEPEEPENPAEPEEPEETGDPGKSEVPENVAPENPGPDTQGQQKTVKTGDSISVSDIVILGCLELVLVTITAVLRKKKKK